MSGLPDGMANVPSQSNHAGEDGQVWERAWTLEEMRQTSANWSLAADSGLFLFLQDFSQRMLSKTHEIEKQLDGLIRDTKATDCCLHTVFNDFLMLSNTQFIENRVYDEEVEEPVPKAETLERQPELEKTREQKEAELIPKVQEAVNFGLRVLDSAFEQLDIKAGNSDSEDEEATDRVEPILEPKDLYVDRPLPYLIGSQLFMEQDDVGLGDLSSEEISIDSDRDSVIDSEDGKDTDQSDEDFDEEGPSSIKKKSSMLSDDDEGEESDIFGESDKDDDDDDCITSLCHIQNTGPSSFADELAARIKGEPISKPEGDRTSIEDDSEELFGPPKMEDEDFSPFGGKGGLFSGGRGLFDDDDEGDLFSDAPKQPVAEEKTRNTAHATEPVNSAKKIPSVAVSIFPENSLFGIPNNSDSVEGRENGSLAKPNKTQTSAPRNTSLGGGGGGLFDDDEEDDFFTGKSLKKSSSAGQKKSKQKKTVDLFGGDDEDEDGDIFSESSVAPPTLQSRKEVVVEEEEVKQAPQKKMPAGGVSMFGPGTKSLLTEALKKRQPSTSEESEENGPPPDVVKTPTKQTEKPQAKSLFSDDEDSQIFQTIPKSQSKPEPTTQSKAPLSIFDDEEEEDLFASAKKSKPSQAKAATPKVKKPVSSSLFSDDEDQWMSSKPSAGKTEGKTEGKTGGMKSSTSAPSSLPSVKAVPKDSLFDEDDDLFAATKESSQKKHQRVSLLFEDEDDEDKGSLFGFKTNVTNSSTTADPKAPVVASPAPSLLPIDKPEVTAPPPPLVVEKPSEEERVAKYKSPEVPSLSSPLEGSESKKKPVGAVSLFGGINVLGDRLAAAKQTKSPLDDPDGDDFLSEGPPPMEKEAKTKKNTLSLFDDVEEEGADWTAPISIPTKPVARNTLKPAEVRPRTKSSTGVFQDEELLFSQTQQRDNDPDVDIFATPDKSLRSRPSSVKSAAPTLFGDDEDDLFSSVKPKAAPPKVSEKPSKPTKDEPSSKPAVTAPVTESEKPTPSPVKSKEPSRIGKLQANLVINPAALLPDAFSRIPGGVSVLPGLSPSPSSSGPSASLSPAGTKPHSNKGVSFENPVQVSTLQSANKGRAKGSIRRRPQTRAARQTSAQRSVEQRDENHGEDQAGPSPTLPSPALSNPTQPSPGLPNLTLPRSSLPNQAPTSALPSSLPASLPSKPLLTDFSVRPSVLTLPVSNTPLNKDSSKGSKVKVLPSLDEDDLFGSDSLFGSAPAPGLNPTIPSPIITTPSPNPTTKTTGGKVTSKNESEKEKETTPQSLFDDPMGDLFKKVKPRSAKKAKASSFLEDEEEDEEDIFGLGKSSTPTTAGGKDSKAGSNSTPKQDIFQDEAATPPKKHKEKSLDASLFDDNVDIFADMTSTSKPKEKKSKKVETKSIFDDDMDDIFSPSTVKPVTKQPPSKSKKNPPSQDTSAADDSGNIFDDPLNALGGN
ncbi:WASH complex subunit 2A isoform X9 [Salmo salar]|uniref:WASH complex subunit 2A isoform X9 n=1 Tax=Salmo salar TaxID=8030 RepID=A0A1S3T2I8_SALSA|nr:WASH complex subunit 2A isoform X9 [Salmo salar]|eukprot:XP_014070811.1 PREDICTED: WASH complex subunit FAM21A-like isoform X7 [Salmo salar]